MKRIPRAIASSAIWTMGIPTRPKITLIPSSWRARAMRAAPVGGGDGAMFCLSYSRFGEIVEVQRELQERYCRGLLREAIDHLSNWVQEKEYRRAQK